MTKDCYQGGDMAALTGGVIMGRRLSASAAAKQRL